MSEEQKLKELYVSLQQQTNRIQEVVEKLIDKVAALETSNAVRNFINEINSNTTTNDIK
jgi:archaellum component FlaF (FlaF/FlaG flagellin family)